MNNWTRKQFLHAPLLTGSTALRSRSRVLLVAAKSTANSDVRMAIVGFNGKGNTHIKILHPCA